MEKDNSNKNPCSSAKKDHQSSATKKNNFPKISLANKLLRKQVKKKLKNKFICDKCEARFPTWWERRTHWLASGHKAPELCRWCWKKTFALQSHLCQKHWEYAVMCPNCGLMFMFQEDFNKHVLQHDKSKYRCTHCGRQRKTKELLRIHVQNHFLYEKYGCNICEKRFKQKKNLEKHLIHIHFICQYCGGTSDSAKDLKNHLKIHDDLKCVLCHKVFSQKNRLKYHYQLLHGHQDFYKCSICFQKFAKKSVLLNHIKLKHKGKSNFSCEICAAPFLYWQQYQNHFERQHCKKIDDKFDCSFCEFSTNLKAKLKWHVEKSSGIGFFCKKCQLRLECKGRFDKHMEMHVGEKDSIWSCDYCPRVYISDNKLRQHMLAYHQEQALGQNPKVHPCLIKGCHSFYVTKSSLARHIRKQHSDSLKTSDVVSNSSKSASLIQLDEETFDNFSDISKEQEVKSKDEEVESIKSKLSLKEIKKSKSTDQIKECSTEKDFYDITEPTEVNVFNCEICDKFWFSDETQYSRHMKSHGIKEWQAKCDCCNILLKSPIEAVRHNVEEHLKVKFVQ